MVSYYNSLSYAQNNRGANLPYPTQAWTWGSSYHHGPNSQFLSEMEAPAHTHAPMYYNPHHMFHPATTASPEWHTANPTIGENFAQNGIPATAHQLMQHHHSQNDLGPHIGAANSSMSSSGSTSNGPISGNAQMHETGSNLGEPQPQPPLQQQHQQSHITEGLPSPPITVSGSEISSPGVPASASSPHQIAHHLNSTSGSNNSSSTSTNNNATGPHNNNNGGSPTKQQYFEWMKKPIYTSQPQPGKTRTKDKYRVVYTDYQRLELEKEYCTSRYITIRRKSELALSLTLSERQVKIWFQNRRAKERKQNKKGSDPAVMSNVQHTEYSAIMDVKTKLESGLHLQHPLHHSMNPMHAAMGMPMRLHPHLAHSHLAASAAAAHSHQLQQQHNAHMSAAAAAGVGPLTM